MSGPALPPGLGQAFKVAVGELGLCAASWLVVEEVEAEGGPALLALLRDELGRDWPVLDAVAAARISGAVARAPDVGVVLEAVGRAERIVCVGLEALQLDALAAASAIPIYVVRQSVFSPDWERLSANYDGRVRFESADTFQRLAGPRSALLTFCYGEDGSAAHVLPAWARVSGADVRAQFRSLLAWEVLHHPFFVYPRWLVSVPTASFSAVIRA